MLKKCNGCGETKDIEEFSLQKNNKDGHKHYCKVCMCKKSMDYYNKKQKELNKPEIEIVKKKVLEIPIPIDPLQKSFLLNHGYKEIQVDGMSKKEALLRCKKIIEQTQEHITIPSYNALTRKLRK